MHLLFRCQHTKNNTHDCTLIQECVLCFCFFFVFVLVCYRIYIYEWTCAEFWCNYKWVECSRVKCAHKVQKNKSNHNMTWITKLALSHSAKIIVLYDCLEKNILCKCTIEKRSNANDCGIVPNWYRRKKCLSIYTVIASAEENKKRFSSSRNAILFGQMKLHVW